jgi:hypothetical protein
MKNRILWLRVSYWAGAAVDAKGTILFLFPGLFPFLTKMFFGNMEIADPKYVNLRIILGAMIGAWTALLVWADRKPLERKGILLFTVFPICLTIIAVRLWNLLNHYQSYKESVGFFVFFIILTSFFIFSYAVNTLHKKVS